MSARRDLPAEVWREGMPGYVRRDWEMIDYRCFQLADSALWFRGPPPATLAPGRYFTALGAAQTFGCFCDAPYPRRLEDALGMAALNLGYSGAGPAFFRRHRELLAHVNRGAFCIVQVMSARSTPNARFDNPEGLAHGRRRDDGTPVTAEAIFDEAIRRDLARIPLPQRVAAGLLKLSGLPLPAARRLARESRENWLRDFRALLEAITVPKILLWFSERPPAYRPRYHRQSTLLGKFPHLVDAAMIDALVPHVDRYVECVSARGLPQPLFSRFTGEPVAVDLADDAKPVTGERGRTAALYAGRWSRNPYYPSPEMHADAARALKPACRALLGAPAAAAAAP